MQKFCPKCYTQTYEDSTFFCYKCGTRLLVHIPEKKDISRSYRIKASDKESMYLRDESLDLQTSASIHPIKPIEFCSQCGDQIIDKNRIFCKNCGAYIREVLSGDVSCIVKHSVLEPPDKTPKVDQNSEVKTIKEQEPALMKVTNLPLNSKVNEWRSIFILAGIVILFFIFMLTLLLVYP